MRFRLLYALCRTCQVNVSVAERSANVRTLRTHPPYSLLKDFRRHTDQGLVELLEGHPDLGRLPPPPPFEILSQLAVMCSELCPLRFEPRLHLEALLLHPLNLLAEFAAFPASILDVFPHFHCFCLFPGFSRGCFSGSLLIWNAGAATLFIFALRLASLEDDRTDSIACVPSRHDAHLALRFESSKRFY